MCPEIIHAAMKVKDLEASIKFYSLLGFKYAYDLKKDDGSIWLVYLANEHHQFIELFPGRDGGDKAVNQSYFHICYKVTGIAEFAHMLQDNGVTLFNGPAWVNNPWTTPYVPTKAKCNSYAFFIQDPDGNDIEVMEYTPESMQLAY